LHVFGHIHEGYGASFDGQTLYVNASNLNLDYDAVNPCMVIDLPHDRNLPSRVVRPDKKCTKNYWEKELPAWFQENGYTVLAGIFSKFCREQTSRLPSGDALVQCTSEAYKKLLPKMKLYQERNAKDVKTELRCALSQLYAESFH
jgi:hypothetical protein